MKRKLPGRESFAHASSVHLFPMAELEDRDLVTPVINEINDPITPLPHPVTIRVPRELFGPLGSRVPGKDLHTLNDTLTISLGAYGFKLLRRRGFDQQLIFGHAVSGPGRRYRRKGFFRLSFQ